MTQHISHSLEKTAAIASEWLGNITAKNVKNIATIVGLSGQLGAGKTAFVKAVANKLGVNEDVTSPTFVLMKFYDIVGKQPSGPDYPWKKLVHIDAYRLEGAQELQVLKFEELATDPKNLVLIEWPENVEEAVVGQKGYSQITFKVGEKDTERVIEY